MSKSAFLDSVPRFAKKSYIQWRNTTDYPSLDVCKPRLQAVQARGYAMTDNSSTAHYMLQANVLQAGKLHVNPAALLSANYGQRLMLSGAAGALTGAASGYGYAGLGVGLGVIAAPWAFDQASKEVSYAVTTDIQTFERPPDGARVHQHTHNNRSHVNHANMPPAMRQRQPAMVSPTRNLPIQMNVVRTETRSMTSSSMRSGT